MAFLPDNFFNKSVNEPFIKELMSLVLEQNDWVCGDPDKFEPDYFCNGTPYEFTIASDRRKKGNFIQNLCASAYTSEDIEEDFRKYIEESISKKLSKHYSVPDVCLCVLCVIDLTKWVMDEYGSLTHYAVDQPREEIFAWIKERCIETGKFKNVFVIFPDAAATWWAWDVLNDQKASVQLTLASILGKQPPFWLVKDAYEEMVGNCPGNTSGEKIL